MSTTTDLSKLVINKVESETVYNYLADNDLINDDELYLVYTGSSSGTVSDSHINDLIDAKIQGLELLADGISGVI